MNFDLTTVNLRTIPKTTALLDQKLSSLDAEQGWWLGILARGELPWGCEWVRECATSTRMRLVIDKQPEGTRSPNLADAIVMAYWPVGDGIYSSMEWV